MQKNHHKLFVGITASSTNYQIKIKKKNQQISVFAQFPIKRPFSFIMKPISQFNNNSFRITVQRSDTYQGRRTQFSSKVWKSYVLSMRYGAYGNIWACHLTKSRNYFSSVMLGLV